MEELIFKKECHTIVGLCMRVHSKLGPGFKEIVYKDALELEFIKNRIPYIREISFKIDYFGDILKHGFVADFIVYGSIVLEIKAKPFLNYDNFTQTLNFIKASELKLGLLINFGESSLRFRRVICTY